MDNNRYGRLLSLEPQDNFVANLQNRENIRKGYSQQLFANLLRAVGEAAAFESRFKPLMKFPDHPINRVDRYDNLDGDFPVLGYHAPLTRYFEAGIREAVVTGEPVEVTTPEGVVERIHIDRTWALLERVSGYYPIEKEEIEAWNQIQKDRENFPLDGSPLVAAARWAYFLGHECGMALLPSDDPTAEEVVSAQCRAVKRGLQLDGDGWGVRHWRYDVIGGGDYIEHETCTRRTRIRASRDEMVVTLHPYDDLRGHIIARLIWRRGESCVFEIFDLNEYMDRPGDDHRLGALEGLFSATGDALLRLAGVESLQELEAVAIEVARLGRFEDMAEELGY